MQIYKFVPTQWIIDEQHLEEVTERQLTAALIKVLNESTVDKYGCWNWIGKSTDKRGSGYIGLGSRNSVAVHRVMFMMFNGFIWPDPQCRHLCGKPTCVNPYHLAIGDVQDNGLDSAFHYAAPNKLAPVDWYKAGARNTKSIAVHFEEIRPQAWNSFMQHLFDYGYIKLEQ